jgi:hypothetical protein
MRELPLSPSQTTVALILIEVRRIENITFSLAGSSLKDMHLLPLLILALSVFIVNDDSMSRRFERKRTQINARVHTLVTRRVQ